MALRGQTKVNHFRYGTFCSSSSSTLQRRSINTRLRLLLLLSFIEKLDSVASTLDFSTVGIKEIIEQGACDMHPGRDTDSDHAECAKNLCKQF